MISTKREQEVLILVCKSIFKDTTDDIIEIISLDECFSWGMLIEESFRQKIQCFLFHFLLHNKQVKKHVPEYLFFLIDRVLTVNKHKNHLLLSEAIKISKELLHMNINHAVTKGACFMIELYPQIECRSLGDIDFICNGQDSETILKLLKGLGYKQGTVSLNTIRQLSRKEKIFNSLFPDHMPKHIKKTNDLFAPRIRLDFSNSITWVNSDFDIPIEYVVKQTIEKEINSNSIMYYNDEFNFIHTCLHIYREAVYPEYKLELKSLIDVLLMVIQWGQRENFHKKLSLYINKYNLNLPIYWVLKHTEDLFDIQIIDLFPEVVKGQDIEIFMQQLFIINKTQYDSFSWESFSIRDRIFSNIL